MNGLMVKTVSLSLWPMAYNERSDGEECQSVFGQWCAVHGLMVKSVRVFLWPMAYNEWSDGEHCQSVPLANGLQ